MLVSNLLRRHKTPGPRFAPGLFLGLLVVFAVLGQTNAVFGLTGLGVTLVATGTLVEINRQRIWDNYRKSFRKTKGLRGFWTQPDPVYYTLNVVFMWPLIIVLGVFSLWAAYILG